VPFVAGKRRSLASGVSEAGAPNAQKESPIAMMGTNHDFFISLISNKFIRHEDTENYIICKGKRTIFKNAFI
jgi:hypothetical protein